MAWTFRTFLTSWKPTAKCVVAVLLKVAGGAAAVADPANQLLYQCLTAGAEQGATVLFDALPAEKQHEVEERFAALQPYLDQHAVLIGRLEALADQQADQNRSVEALTVMIRDQLPAELHTAVQRSLPELRDLLGDIQREVREIKEIVKNFKPGVSYENEAERAFLRQQREKFRQLAPAQQKAADWSNLADRLGEAGLYELAQEEHNNAAKAAAEEHNLALAAAEHFKAFRAACEKEQWSAALASLRQAVALNPLQAPFDWEQFEVLEILGAGGGGTVFRCRDRHLDEEVAIKAIHTGDLARGVQEVFKEAAILTKLNHPAIIAVKAARFADAAKQRPYIVMEYFPSRSLAARLQQHGPLPVAEFLRVVRPVAEALRAGHNARPRFVYHRDVKPDNVLQGDAGQIKVIDFGLAMRIEAVHKSMGTDPQRRSQKEQSYVGTLEYMPPEQQGGLKPVGPYSDIYAFGRTCCKLLFGFPTLSRHTDPKTQAGTRHWNRKTDPVPQPLVDLLERCVQHAAEDRPQDFQEVLDVLDELEKPVPPMAIPMVRFVCTCGKRLKAPHSEAGRKVKCPDCGKSLVIPPQDTDQPSVPEPPPPKEPPVLLQAPFTAAKAKEIQAAWAAYLGRKVEEVIDLGGGVKLELVLVPPGSFLMGSPTGEKDRSDDEDQHPVTITRPFYLGKYHVTRGQFAQFVRASGYKTEAETDGGAYVWNGKTFDKDAKANWRNPVSFQQTDEHPVVCVSWNDAQAFLAWLQAHGGRLPTEAEWEYACRAGTLTPFWFGAACNGEQFNCDGNYPYGTTTKGKYLERTCKVGGDVLTYKPNAYGLFDMHGNAWQWCMDYYGPYKDLNAEDPKRLEGGSDRVLRGGSWFNYARLCRSANRDRVDPSNRNDFLGFRLAVPVQRE